MKTRLWLLIVFSILLFSCGSKTEQKQVADKTDIAVEQAIILKNNSVEITNPYQKAQDSLRTLLLASKPNANLKSSVLEELYIRGFVDQVGNNIKFELPFNVHTTDCGAPDCFTTDISFEILAIDPI
ncbi:unnamed protein product, partial [Ectocarpus sp. 12 AP-2014]